MKHIKLYEEFVNEPINESAGDWIVPLMALWVAAPLLAVSAAGLAMHAIGSDDLYSPKEMYDMWKRDKIVNKVVARLNADEEIQDFLKLKDSQQRGKWRDLVASKLSPAEIKHLNSISRDRVEKGKI